MRKMTDPSPPTYEFTQVILDSVADGVFTVDADWRITSFNRAAGEITGVHEGDAIGSLCHEVFRANVCETGCPLRETMETGQPVVNRAVYIIRTNGRRVPISVSAAVLKDPDGRIIGGVETFRDLTVVEELRKELASSRSFQDIVTRNKQMRKIFTILPDIAESESTVLISGPSGSGKELFARAVHTLSPRKKGPLVVVNCGAIPDTLLESELFGYKAGAFTDAKRDKKGKFALARGGTIFLDEVGDITPALQVRLLRVLQERVFEPLGSTKPEVADVRVVAATNKDLEELTAKGEFREDLYYRLNVIPIRLPPLNKRKEDIPLLCAHFVQRLSRLRGKDIVGVSQEAMAVLMRHHFPGNVRELENIIEYSFVLCHSGLIQPQHLPEELVASQAPKGPTFHAAMTFEQLEARFIYEALKRNNFKKIATARELGINKTTLWRKIKKLGIRIPE